MSSRSTPTNWSPGIWLVIIIVLIGGLTRGCRESPPDLKDRFQTAIAADKQKWFERFHPVGTAKSVKVHDANASDTANGRQASVRFTLYWEGPLTKDGFTKIRAVHDAESNRWVRAEILETNGTTNTQAVEGISAFVGGLLQSQ